MLPFFSTALLGSQPLLACNVYVSAGRRHQADFLLKILSEAQVMYSWLVFAFRCTYYIHGLLLV
jgi:hypothetical protein